MAVKRTVTKRAARTLRASTSRPFERLMLDIEYASTIPLNCHGEGLLVKMKLACGSTKANGRD